MNFTERIKLRVSGSTITGDTDATLYLSKSVTSFVFSVAVKLLPLVDLIEIKTLPYCAVSTTPREVSYEPSSPPQTVTLFVFGNNFLA